MSARDRFPDFAHPSMANYRPMWDEIDRLTAELDIAHHELARLKLAVGEQTEMVRVWKNRAHSQRSKAMRRLARLREAGLQPPAPIDQEAAW